jgi:Fe-S-cluster containining protein
VIKQFIPNGYCLKCQGCCRFKEENSVWAPCLMDEEIQGLLDKPGLPAAWLSRDRRIHPVPAPSSCGGFICPFLDITENSCKIYSSRPFECQLYPFLITLRSNKVLLTVDLNCPYMQEAMKRPECKDYTEYLMGFLNTPARLKLLKSNPQIIQAYEEVAEVMELNLS